MIIKSTKILISRSTVMEPQERIQLINRLMEEATQHLELLHRAIAAQWVSREGSHQAAQHALDMEEHITSQAKRVAWEKAHRGLTEVRSALEQLAQLEPPSKVMTKAAGA
jgi:hypothetical protein